MPNQDVNVLNIKFMKGGNKPGCQPCQAVIIYSAIIIAIIIVSDLINLWGQGWPKLVILLMALYILLEPIRPYLGKKRRLVNWLMATVTCLLVLIIIISFLGYNIF